MDAEHTVARRPAWRAAAAAAAALATLALLPCLWERSGDCSAGPSSVLILVFALHVLVGLAVLAAGKALAEGPQRRAILFAVLAAGLVLRLVFMPWGSMGASADYNRFLWDGGVLAHGYNPYAYSPAEALAGGARVPPGLHELACQSQPLAGRVLHPGVRTIYPPIAQLGFALAHLISPWRVEGWMVVLVLFDLATAALLLWLLAALGLPQLLVVLYWWNPRVLVETYTTGHMDVLVLPFLLGSLALAVRHRHLAASAVLVLAAGVKVWPLALVPLFLRPLWKRPRRLLGALGLAALLALVLAAPILLARFDPQGGFSAYGQHWEDNSSLFKLVKMGVYGVAIALGALPLHPPEHPAAEALARLLVAAALGVVILLVVRREPRGGRELCDRALVIVAAIFLLSPTQFPWYYIWLVPLLALRPRIALLALTPLLGLYYTKAYFGAWGLGGWFDFGVVWLEFAPVWALLIRDRLAGRARLLSAAAELPRGRERAVLFTRYPRAGQAKTRLIPALGARGAAALQRSMSEHIAAALGELEVEREVRFTGGDGDQMRAWLGRGFRYADQGGGDLGARLARAFDAAFGAGVARCVVLGSDCPALDARVLGEALAALRRADLVIGPATDGGYVLIGLRCRQPALFEGITWGSDRVLAQTLAAAQHCGLSVELLEPLGDVDRPEDLPLWEAALEKRRKK